MTFLNICNKHNDDYVFNKVNAINRDDDISARGELCKVYDYDGNMVYLKDAQIWFNNDGNYVEPRIYIPHFCDGLFDFCKRSFCIHIE